jgi:hypothetical protein
MPPPLAAQRLTAAAFPELGTRVRLTAVAASPSRVVVTGTLRRVSGDSAIVIEDRGGQRGMSMSEVVRLEVSRGRSRRAGARRGLAYGPLVGMTAGGVIGALLGASGNSEFGPAGRGEATLFGAALGLVIGISLGPGVGAALGVERWERRWTSPSDRGA